MILEINFNESNRKERVEINKSTCVIGRSPKADCQIDMECFSRSNIEIEWNGKDFFITDLNSTNGVYINNERIPVATKTLFKNFFPLEVGGAVSISVFSEDVQTESVETPIIRNTISSHTTTSIGMSSGPKKGPRKKKSSEQASQSKIYFLVPAVIAIAAFYFYHNYFNEEQAEGMTAQVQSVKEISSEPTFNKTDSELKSLIASDQCGELTELCQSLKLTHPQEKLTITGSEIILYVNYPAVLAEMKSAFLPNEPMDKQAEYVLASYAYQPKVVSEAVSRNLSHIVVAGIDPLDDLIRIKYSVVLNVKDAPKFSSEDHLSFFSNIYHGGIYRPYKKFLRPYLKITNY